MRNWGDYLKPDKEIWLPPTLVHLKTKQNIDFLTLDVVELTEEQWKALFIDLYAEYRPEDLQEAAEQIKCAIGDRRNFKKDFCNMLRMQDIWLLIQTNIEADKLRDNEWKKICTIFSRCQLDFGYQYAIFACLSGVMIDEETLNDSY